MNELKVFNFNQVEVRTVFIDNEPWWIAKDVCDVLGHSNVSVALTRLDSDEVTKFNLGGLSGESNVVNESGLYSLIMGSRKPEAKAFKKWVTGEVLPSIRKNGMYATEVTVEKMLNDPDFAIELLTSLKEERAKRIEVEKTNTILMHVNKNYTSTEIAKEMGLKSANELNEILAHKRIQYKQNETWVLYSEYANKGYTDIKQQVLDNGKVIYNRKWTQLGRKFLLELLEN